ncbi:hypothetical protein [Desulfosporosinus fructosivorans]|uniref:hypothetical protein n=1 Tax=Desulfosporosinus fructosivorans TaxID=2018669 RepID=UPI00130E099E|nr:hypothetical protein [Desulfosporosinus fructosivorans]
MTQRSVLTTQSKLAVQAPKAGAGRNTSECFAKCAVLGAMRAEHPCSLPRIWGRFHGVC